MKNIPYTVGIVISLPHGEILTDKIGVTYNIKDHFSEIMTKSAPNSSSFPSLLGKSGKNQFERVVWR